MNPVIMVVILNINQGKKRHSLKIFHISIGYYGTKTIMMNAKIK